MMLSSNATMVNDAFRDLQRSLNDSYNPNEYGDYQDVYEAFQKVDAVKTQVALTGCMLAFPSADVRPDFKDFRDNFNETMNKVTEAGHPMLWSL